MQSLKIQKFIENTNAIEFERLIQITNINTNLKNYQKGNEIMNTVTIELFQIFDSESADQILKFICKRSHDIHTEPVHWQKNFNIHNFIFFR